MSLTLENIGVVYGENTPFRHTALKDISIAFPKGKVTGIIGPTGSGKSTLAMLLNGLLNAVFMLCRLLSLFLGSSVILTYTTSPLDLTDGIERLLSPLRHLHVPVHDFAMMMTIALRFIPTLIEETDKIMSAQKARGSDFETGSLLRRLKAMIPILIPLFYSAIRRAYDLAEAMECRCYNGGANRTRMKVPKARFSDFAFLFVMLVCTAAVVLLNGVSLS